MRRDPRVTRGRSPLNIPKEIIMIARFIQDEAGATAIEYGLIAALIAVVIITALTAIGTNLSSAFNSVSSSTAAA